MPRVSVIIPNFNRAGLIGQTISNLLNQSMPPAEIVVVDDGSTDDSLAVIQSFGSAVKLLKQNNQGPGAARNAGLELVTGEFVQFQDSDDLLSLNKLESQAKLLEVTGADIALSPWAHVIIRNENVTLESCVLQQSLPPPKASLAGWLLRGWFTVFQSLLFRRSLLLAAGRYETDTRYGEDMEFLFRLASRSPRVVLARETLTLYRVNSANNLSSDGGASQNSRVVDWARCLERMGRHQALLEGKMQIDASSRAIFLAAIRKQLRSLRNVPGAPPELIRELSAQMARLPETYLAAVELWHRILERLRLARTGWRWMPGLQAGLLTAQQRQLIQDLGFRLTP